MTRKSKEFLETNKTKELYKFNLVQAQGKKEPAEITERKSPNPVNKNASKKLQKINLTKRK